MALASTAASTHDSLPTVALDQAGLAPEVAQATRAGQVQGADEMTGPSATPDVHAPSSGLRRLRRTGGPHRVDAFCLAAGFAAPPAHVHLRFLAPATDRRVLLLRTAPAALTLAARWLERYKPTRITKGPGLAPSLLRAEFHAFPEQWNRMLEAVGVQCVDLTADGVLTLFVDGSAPQITRLAALLGPEGTVQVRPTRGLDANRPTPHQLQALANAVALGYYDIPRRVDLRTLARRMGISLGSVAELLRRGEEAVVTAFMDDASSGVWGGPWGDQEAQETQEAQEVQQVQDGRPVVAAAAAGAAAGPVDAWMEHGRRVAGLVHCALHGPMTASEQPVDVY